MIKALPIWHCLDFETQVKLAQLLEKPGALRPDEWIPWLPSEIQEALDEEAEYQRLKKIARFMSQPPHHPRQVK